MLPILELKIKNKNLMNNFNKYKVLPQGNLMTIYQPMSLQVSFFCSNCLMKMMKKKLKNSYKKF